MRSVCRETADTVVCAFENERRQTPTCNKIRLGYGARGSLRKIWIHNIKDILNKYGYSVSEETHLAF